MEPVTSRRLNILSSNFQSFGVICLNFTVICQSSVKSLNPPIKYVIQISSWNHEPNLRMFSRLPAYLSGI